MRETSRIAYTILTDDNPNHLQQEVVEWLSDGYLLAGGIAIYKDEGERPVFVQALYRP